ncbi:MAG: pilus assembly protein [Maricaulaceae bacterium]|jgi:Flp pilus assembly pilin Flp
MTNILVNTFRRARAAFASFAKRRDGVAATEFALIAPILAGMLLGVIELGMVTYDRTDMHASLRNGAQYFMAGGDDIEAARSIVVQSWAAAAEGETASIDIVSYCECAGAGAPCGALCQDDSVPDVFKELRATTILDGIFGTYEIEANETVRTR